MKNLGILYGRETVRCECGLVQFMTERQQCRRCKLSFIEPEAPPDPVTAPLEEVQRVPQPLNIGGALRTCRRALRLSQSALAAKVLCVRTYISKIENNRTQLGISQIERLCEALGLPVRFFIELCEVRGL
jgi:antitoxin component HigA of HigAB toxin-antitoxin module